MGSGDLRLIGGLGDSPGQQLRLRPVPPRPAIGASLLDEQIAETEALLDGMISDFNLDIA